MAPHNMSWVQYPSRVSPAVEDVIAAQSVIARCVHVYVALFVPLSLVAGLFNLSIFLRGCARLGGLDALLLDLTVTNLLGTLLSLSAASRPDYLATTHLSCTALSFLSNLCYFNGQYVQLATLSVFLPQGPPSCLCPATTGAWGPALGLAALAACALCSSLAVVVLLGMSGELHRTILCQLDPLTAWPEYEIVKVSLGFGFALILELAFSALLVIWRTRRAAPPQRGPGSAHPAVLAIALTTFTCRLLYNAALLRRARLKLQQDIGSPRDELLMSLAELVLGGEGCVNALATLLLHQPCRLALRTLPGRLARSCHRGEARGGFSLQRVGS